MAIRVQVEYFAAARELCGTRQEALSLPAEAATGTSLMNLIAHKHPALAPVLSRMRLAVNGELVNESVRLADGDEVGVLPPVAGGSVASTEPLCGLRTSPLSVDEVLAALRAPDVGGIALFIGTVRDHAGSTRVVRLDYEAHGVMAERELRRIVDELAAEHPGVRLAALHRVGELAIGDAAVIVGAGAAHRAEAFTACRALIERIKERVPIWKKEWADDGSGSWVNLA